MGCKVVAVEGFKDEGQKRLVNEFDTFTGKIRRLGTEDKIILKEEKVINSELLKKNSLT